MGRDTPFASPWEGTNHANGEASPSAWEGRVITDTWIHKPLRQVVLLLIFSSTRSLCPCVPIARLRTDHSFVDPVAAICMLSPHGTSRIDQDIISWHVRMAPSQDIIALPSPAFPTNAFRSPACTCIPFPSFALPPLCFWLLQGDETVRMYILPPNGG